MQVIAHLLQASLKGAISNIYFLQKSPGVLLGSSVVSFKESYHKKSKFLWPHPLLLFVLVPSTTGSERKSLEWQQPLLAAVQV